jgi:hypothetical protein
VDPPRGVLLLGDLTHTGELSDWIAFTNDFGLKGERRLQFPVYEGYGNHDLGASVLPGICARNPSRPGVSNFATNGYHYSWDWDSLHLVCLNLFPGDSSDNSLESNLSLFFLEEDLARNVGDSGRPVLIYQHYGFDDMSCRWWSDQERTNYFEVIKKYNVIAIFAGHNHLVDYVPWCGLATFNDGTMGKSLGDFLVVHVTGTRLSVVERAADGTWGASFTQSITVSNPPVVVAYPQSTNAVVGASVTLSVHAVGPSLSYQWFFRDTNAIPGATNSTLTLSNLTFQQTGDYTVTITNPAGSVTTPPAFLTVEAMLEATSALVLAVSGPPAAPLILEYRTTLSPAAAWSALTTVTPANATPIFVELSRDQPQGFYRTTPPALTFQVGFIPALTVLGDRGTLLRLEFRSALDPLSAWQPLATLPMTGEPQPYLDTSAFGQPPRSYRATGVP